MTEIKNLVDILVVQDICDLLLDRKEKAKAKVKNKSLFYYNKKGCELLEFGEIKDINATFTPSEGILLTFETNKGSVSLTLEGSDVISTLRIYLYNRTLREVFNIYHFFQDFYYIVENITDDFDLESLKLFAEMENF